ncbi:MAG: hypothetical protein H0U59_12340 [Gemmatimonadaceae bacterium]|nr:hypothetical protein [Gemmatimonadaceae bacterium]
MVTYRRASRDEQEGTRSAFRWKCSVKRAIVRACDDSTVSGAAVARKVHFSPR